MLLLCSVCAVLIGWCLGGRLTRYERAGLRWPLFAIAALICRSALNYLTGPAVSAVLLSGSYLFLFIFLWRNRHLLLPVLFIGLGSLSNFIVIAANGFVMPVSAHAVNALSAEGTAALLAGEIPMYRMADSATRLRFLGDVLWFPVPFFKGFASLGDILLCIGIFFLLMAIMGPTRLKLYGNRNVMASENRRS